MAERERVSTPKLGSGMESDPATTWEQSLDKERDIRGTKSDAHVLNNGPAQAQLINGYFITSDHRGLLSPFCEYWVSMSSANLTLPQDGHAVVMDQRSFTSANVSSPLLTAFHV